MPEFDGHVIGCRPGLLDSFQVGEPLIVVGNPLGLEGTVSTGVVSGIRELEEGFRVIQTDAATNPGNSGGPILNSKGEVVGILSFGIRGGEGLNFWIPINYARGLLSTKQSYSLAQFREELASFEGDVFAEDQPPKFPTRWKSLVSGTEKVLRFQGDYIYIETVGPPDVVHFYQLSMAEAKKENVSYKGVYRERFTCQWRKAFYGWVDNSCYFEFPFEITILMPERIEGSVESSPEGAKLNCRKCKYSKKPVKQSFASIPMEP